MNEINLGEVVTPMTMRQELAQSNVAEYTCPVNTGIFLRIVAEADFEALNNNKKVDQITPFWRAIEAGSPLAKKLNCGNQFIVDLQQAEQKPD